MATKHTPGPWRMWADDWSDKLNTRKGDYGVGSTGEDGTRLATVHESEDEAEANARLMAAAPAMLGALQDLVEDFGAMTGGCESLDVARAILKHLGVAP